MKKLLLIIFLFTCSISFAQEKEPETARPSYGVTVERYINYASINGKLHSNVTVTLKAAGVLDLVEGVKVVVRDSNNKVIHRKRYSQSFLYGFSKGLIQVGKGNILTQIIIQNDGSQWIMELRDKG